MKRSQYTAEQVAFALRQAESGTQVSEVCRKMGISEQTFYYSSRSICPTFADDIQADAWFPLLWCRVRAMVPCHLCLLNLHQRCVATEGPAW
jgi:putative transposase